MVEKVLDDGRHAFGYRGTVVLDDTKQRGHWVEQVVLKEFNDNAFHTPDVGSRRSRSINHLGTHPSDCNSRIETKDSPLLNPLA